MGLTKLDFTIEDLQLSKEMKDLPVIAKYDEAVKEYERCSVTKIGRLIANRELPILNKAKLILGNYSEY